MEKVYYVKKGEIYRGYVDTALNECSDKVNVMGKNKQIYIINRQLVSYKKRDLKDMVVIDNIMYLANKKGIKTRIIGDTLYCNSKLDEWSIRIGDDRIKLYHFNSQRFTKKSLSCGSKGVHLQNTFNKNKPSHCIDAIISHDDFKLNGRKLSNSRITKLYDMISSNSVPKMKIC